MRIVLVTIGSRGDVQPLVALGLGLRAAGHEVRLATHATFETFVREHGLDFVPLAGDPRDLLEALTTAKAGASLLRFLQITMAWSRSIVDRALDDIWEACRDADAAVYGFIGLPTYHAVEKLGIPGFSVSLFPVWCPTRAFPAVTMPYRLPSGDDSPLAGVFHVLTHHAERQAALHAYRLPFNRWRRERLHLPPLPLIRFPYDRLHGRPVPVLFAYSPTVLPRPSDWPEHVHTPGYWFLPHADDWEPPGALIDFLNAGPPPVYIGFGSLVGDDPEALADLVLRALAKAGQRGVLVTGWGGVARRHDAWLAGDSGPAEISRDVFFLESCPHDWLFPRMAAVVHHGGAGTTAAGLRAGVPSILVPFFGDQPFWGQRVRDLGVGPEPIPPRELTVERLAYAIRVAVEHGPIRQRAAALGEQIRAEDGVGEAVRIINHYLKG